MNPQADPIGIVGSSCRLPGGVRRTSGIWDALSGGEDKLSATPPTSRYFAKKTLFDVNDIGKAGWIDDDGVITFDPSFFNITPAEASSLRPNTRLSLELTWEALEVAGIPPGPLKGKNVSVTIGVGTEDGWDLKRYVDDDKEAFDMHWAASSDPSGVSGHVSHFFDFRGPSTVVSSACSSAALALRHGVNSILHDDCDIAIVGGITTHFSPAPFDWASAVNVASRKGQCASFSDEADGYVPSEGAVFFVLRKHSVAKHNNNPIHGIIRSIAVGHSGSTRALASPNVEAQEAICRKAIKLAGLKSSDVDILEAHGTGTRLGDAIELEAIRKVHDNIFRGDTLWLSSSKTVFGHCQASSAFVGILKILSCFQRRAIPPHGVGPSADLLDGRIRVPISLTHLCKPYPLVAQVNSFGFTGSIASFILEEPPRQNALTSPLSVLRPRYFLPFSGKSSEALAAFIRTVCDWALQTTCSLNDLGAILSLSREHYAIRRCLVLSNTSELALLRDDPLRYRPIALTLQVLEESEEQLEESLRSLTNDSLSEHKVPSETPIIRHPEQTVAGLYESGHDLCFEAYYDLSSVPRYGEYLQTFPTYPFQRKVCWNDGPISGALFADRNHGGSSSPLPHTDETVNKHTIIKIISNIVNTSQTGIPSDVSIFDLGIDSISSIELAETLSHVFGYRITTTDLYSLLTVDALFGHFSRKSLIGTDSRKLQQSDVNRLLQIYGAPFDRPSPVGKETDNDSDNVSNVILLTGGNGMLGCHILHSLLLDPSCTIVFCLVRGEAWDRLSSAYDEQGYDLDALNEAKTIGRLKVYKTTKLDDEMLGCTREEYENLSRSVDTIIHAAWRVDFNLPIAGFEDCLSATRNIAELSIRASKKVSYFFLSSFSAYFGYKDILLPEEPLSPLLEYSLDQGYAASKLIAEHSLITLHERHPTSFNLRIVRIGQICGNSVTGDWNQDEMIPMMIRSASSLNAMLRNLPDVSWIPSDVCADVIHDFISCPISDTLTVLHVANPDIVPWRDVVGIISSLLNIPGLPLLSDAEYVSLIQNAGKKVPIHRLTPYLAYVVDHGGFPGRYCSLEVHKTLKHSQALQSCPKIDMQFLSSIVAALGKTNSSFPRPVYTPISPVLLFGPWSNKNNSADASQTRVSFQIKTLLEGLVSDTRRTIGYHLPDHSLERQIESLAIQLSAVDQLTSSGVEPVAVLGYCFGEFAAAIAGGILTESDVVGLLVRRAAALCELNGSMLNVFEEETTVRRLLLRLTFPPDLAIFAGPRHIVLSGTGAQINDAHELLRTQGIKCKLVPTSLPFHSSALDDVINHLELPHIQPNHAKCIYVSGLIGSPVSGTNLGRAYWLRHMRDPVRFYPAMQYLRGKFSKHPLYNCGPGKDLVSVLARYEWDDMSFSSTSKACVSSDGDRRKDTLGKGRLKEAEGDSNDHFISAEDKALDILTETFLYPHKFGLLSRSFQDLGLQSMDFVKFTDLFSQKTGLTVPPSSYISGKSIKDVITAILCI